MLLIWYIHIFYSWNSLSARQNYTSARLTIKWVQLDVVISAHTHITTVKTRFPCTTLQEGTPSLMPYNRAKHGAFLYPLCLRRRLSINSCGAWVREDRLRLPFSVAWPSIQPQTAPHWLPTWRKERCLGTLPGFQKQTPLFLALTRFSSSYFPFAAVSFLLVLLLFLQCKSISCLSVTKVDMHPAHPPSQRKQAY